MFNLTYFFSAGFFILLTKLSFLIISLLLFIFLLVVFKQVLSLNTIIDDGNDSYVIKAGALILIILGLSLFLTALVIL